jgi:hypothetical protein
LGEAVRSERTVDVSLVVIEQSISLSSHFNGLPSLVLKKDFDYLANES